jgi:ABC-type polysaccharide/polyol phosphate transport system ATPase subunit
MSNDIVDVDNVKLVFNLASEKTDSFKEYVVKLIKGQLNYQEFVALDNISFHIRRGESVGLIGANGSGKSTMLKCIAGIYKPTNGKITVKGNIAPLIELGAGFDSELTARENIFLNGAVMGLSKSFMEKKFDEIVEFSELTSFLDVPIKNFSSGMTARLGFAIATIVQPEILIVDEVLAVGDAAFQIKCKQKMFELRSGGTTMLFVSHDIVQVKEICDRAVWLSHGKMILEGKSKDVCEKYQEWSLHHSAFE